MNTEGGGNGQHRVARNRSHLDLPRALGENLGQISTGREEGESELALARNVESWVSPITFERGLGTKKRRGGARY